MNIQVISGTDWSVHRSALQAFGEAFGASFEHGEPGHRRDEPRLACSFDPTNFVSFSRGERVLWVPEREPVNGPSIDSIELCDRIPGRAWLRGRTIRLARPTKPLSLVADGDDMVLARSAAGPIWLRRRDSGGTTDIVAMPLDLSGPQPGMPIHVPVTPQNFASLLPLMQFVRELTCEDQWSADLQACFIFDDPNLHSRRYGFIDFAALADDAQRRGYHVAFATVPLDSWYTSAEAAAIFGRSLETLSLLIHGNDHVAQELGRPYANGERQRLLAQALRRIVRLERVTGLKVCRIMAAPHGLCAEEMMREMAGLGFAAACVSHTSIRPVKKPLVLGAQPAETLAGLPVIPRYGMDPEQPETALLAAYLGQPMIPTGHHQDLACGLEPLHRIADQINQLGRVHWRRMSEIATNLYERRQDGDMLVVRPHTSLTEIRVPDGASKIRVELPRRMVAEPARFVAEAAGGARCEFGVDEAVDTRPGETLILKRICAGSIEPASVRRRRSSVQSIVRRLACEARDRLTPFLKRA